MTDINQERVKRIFDYVDGVLIYKVDRGANKTKGLAAGWSAGHGYTKISINKKYFYAHRLIFLWHHGYLPDEIDHIDGDRGNNKIENLRECNRSQNQMNCKIQKRSKSGIKGVYWHGSTKKWMARIGVNGKYIYLGIFKNILNAKSAIEIAREKYHKGFVNHG